eukprot:10221048-Heterocapsa_arctica.AAC.1
MVLRFLGRVGKCIAVILDGRCQHLPVLPRLRGCLPKGIAVTLDGLPGGPTVALQLLGGVLKPTVVAS